MDDILQKLINDQTEHFGCNNCELGYCFHYLNKNKICSGIVKQPNPELHYDIIRLCIETSDGIHPYDYTPDEVSSIVTVLNHSLGDWLNSTKAYQKFRNVKTEDKLEQKL